MKQDPTDYQSWTPASTCEIGSAIGGIIGGIGSLIGGSMTSDAAGDASDAQVRAAEIAAGVSREALGFQKEVYNVGRADLAPYRATGAGALQTMNNMFLPGGHPMVQMQGRLNELRAEKARLMSAGWQDPMSTPGADSPGITRIDVPADRGGGDRNAGGRSNVDRDFNDEFGRDFGDTEGGGASGPDPGESDPQGAAGGGQGSSADAPGNLHKGGPITDNNPKTYRNNMRITAQEGEVVMSRSAVEMLGRNFLMRANKAAQRRAA